MDSIYSWLLGGSLGSAITFLYNVRENKKKAHFSNVSNQRIKWTEELKKNIAGFIADIQSFNIAMSEERLTLRKGLIEKMEAIEINLNPIFDDFDEEYIRRMREIYTAAISLRLQDNQLSNFRELSQRMVKIEWEGIKLEAEKGNPSKQEKLKLKRKWL